MRKCLTQGEDAIDTRNSPSPTVVRDSGGGFPLLASCASSIPPSLATDSRVEERLPNVDCRGGARRGETRRGREHVVHVGRSFGRPQTLRGIASDSSSRTIPLEGCLHHSIHGVITREVRRQGGLSANDKQLDLACKSSRASVGRRSIMPAVKGGRERTSLTARPAPVSARAGRLRALRGEFSSWPETAEEKGVPEGAMTGRGKL